MSAEEQAQTQEGQTCCLWCGCLLVLVADDEVACPECKREAQ